MYHYTITIPQAYNTGARVETALTESFEATMLDTFGGFTAQEATGAWRDGGTVYREPVTVYTLDSDEDESGAVESLARTVCDALSQECVYVTTQAPDGALSRAFVESSLATF